MFCFTIWRSSLQKAWALEHNTQKSGINLVSEQVKELKPDVLFVQDTINFNSQWVENLKKEVKSIKLFIGSCCHPFNEDQLNFYKSFDFMITCSDLFLNAFNKAGIKTFKLPHAFEHSLLKELDDNNKYPENDLIFIGSLISGNEHHKLRTSIIERILESDIDFKIYSKLIYDNPHILKLKQFGYISSKILNNLGLKNVMDSISYFRKFNGLTEFPRNPIYSDRLKNAVDRPLYGLDMYKALSKAKMGLNIHGTFGGGNFAANIRLFEVTGVGACLVTDWKKNLHELFIPDEEVVTFKSVDECIEKVKWLKDNPSEREKIAKAGQERTLKDHTFKNRVNQLDTIIRKELSNT